MGSSHSKLAASSLEELSVDDISSFVVGLGSKYEAYGDAITANAVDGELLASLEDDAELKETMKCLEITNFLHQKVLLKELKKIKQATGKDDIHKGREIDTCVTESGSDSDDLTTSTAPSDIDDLIPSEITVKTLEALELQEEDHGLTVDSPELEPYRNVATRALDALQGSMAAVNLVSLQNTKGHNSLCTVMNSPEGVQAARWHYDGENDISFCRATILGSNEDSVQLHVPVEFTSKYGLKEAARYYGHVVKCNNMRVGIVCAVVEESKVQNTTDDEKQVILKFLAAETERQLQRRRVLVQRNHNLKKDIDELKREAAPVDEVLLPAYGPLKPVMASQVDARLELFPYPEHPESEVRRSSELPSWSGAHLASDAERAHMAPNYYDDLSRFPIDRTPVGKRDLEQVAHLNSLGILDMDPLAEEAKAILSLVSMAGRLLGGDYIFLNLLDHQYRHTMCPTLCGKHPPEKLKKLLSVNDHLDMVKEMPDGSPFLMRGDRCTAICNYAVSSPHGQSFVIHDMAKDQSFSLYKKEYDIGFCSASPILIHGVPVGALCMICREARPDFGKAQEVQQEQFAQLISQQFETWAMNREMNTLERERSMLISNNRKMRANRPEDYAALVFTDVQGSTVLWEANADAMQKASNIHNQIIRHGVAAHSGYEVNQEGAAFHLAFADVVDAVQFCLKTQEALYMAPWDRDILALSYACEDATGCLRGLRVRMAIHAGDVVSRTSDLSGRVEYEGDTPHIAKSLECMGHGGQILVTSDVWNVASHLAESTLGSPQVIDLGDHVMLTHSQNMHDGIVAKNVLQLVPSSLSHDYLESRRVATFSGDEETIVSGRTFARGRTFPPVMTKKRLGPSFHDAPFAENTVAIVCVITSEAETLVADPTVLLAALSKRIGTILSSDDPVYKGYQCMDFVLAFGDVADAVRFGLALQEYLEHHKVLGLSLSGVVKVGVHEGAFTTMGPHPTTGRADYVGKVVDRAARVADAAAPGSVYLGKQATALDECNLMPLSNGYMLDFLGVRPFNGVREEFALYKCHACNSWYNQLMSNKQQFRTTGTRASLLPKFQG